MYNEIRNKILQYERLFTVIHFFFTPIRVTREFLARRKMAHELIKKYSMLKQQDDLIFYFGIPEHNNLGDLAQTYCTRKWIKENFPKHKVVEVRTRISFDVHFINFVRSLLTEQDIFMFQSGYCTRSKNADHLMHLNIMSKFPNQRAIILPQTVNIKSKKDIYNTKKIFSQCTRLLFIARDKISYNKAKEFIPEACLELYPDIVTSLIGRGNKNVEKSGVMLCVRNDAEKFYTDNAINDLRAQLEKKVDRVDITDTNSDLDVWDTYNNLEKIIREKIDSFNKYEVVITDRYHGTIFSLIANTPVVVVKTNDHKVSSGVEWFEGVYSNSSVQLASTLEEAEKLAIRIVDEKKRVVNSDYFFCNYYKNRLRERIEQIVK